jgi:hypothetical protein
LEGQSIDDLGREGSIRSKNFELHRSPYGLKISYRWYRRSNIFLFVFMLIWTLPFLFVMFLLLSDTITSGEVSWTILFPIPFLVGGILILYWSLAGLINWTTIEVQGGKLSVHHHPLPWFGQRDYSASEVDQVYIKEAVQERSSSGEITELHTLLIRLKDGKKVKLVHNIDSFENAQYLESTIESALHICDQRVDDECIDSISDRALKQIETMSKDLPSSMSEAHLSQIGRLNPSWELTSNDDGRTLATFTPDKGIGVNRQLVYTGVILAFMFSIILFLSWSAAGSFPLQLLFLPVVFIAILLYSYRTLGSRTYLSQKGRFQYRAKTKKGSLNSMTFECLNVDDRTCSFTEEAGTIKFSDGARFHYTSGARVLNGGRYGVMRSDFRSVDILLFGKDKEGNDSRPVVMVKDMSGPDRAQAIVHLGPVEGEERYIEQLTGFAVYLFHMYKTNPRFYVI